jgi:hypothetical protein
MPVGNFAIAGVEVIAKAAEHTRKAVESLPSPKVDIPNRRSALQMCAAVAVDAGQSLFGGALRDAGIAVFQVASSQEGEDPRTYPFWVDPSLPEDDRHKVIRERLDELASSDPTVHNFVQAMGWQKAYEAMQPSAYDSAAALGDFVRDLLEWSELYRLANVLDSTRQLLLGFQPILLRDGTLRFGTTAANVGEPLGRLFQNLNVPIFGVTKGSRLIANPVVRLWLMKHGVFSQDGPFCVWLDAKDFQELGWRLERYFGQTAFRFGRYALVRCDPMPGSRNIFAVDIPGYLFDDHDKTMVLLSGLIQQATATAYPIPGYPVALQKAHEKVALTEDKARMLENTLRRSLPPDVYDFLKTLETGG